MASTLAAAALGAGSVSAQDPSREARAVTIIGGDAHARRCVRNVLAGDTTDLTVAECARALEYPRLAREGQLQLRVNYGVVLMRRQQAAEAVEQFDLALALDANYAEAHLNRGAALIQLRQYGPAVAAITQALGLGVAEPHKAYFNRGAAREALGDLRGAYEDYNTALEIEPDWGPANAELARFARSRREHLANALGDRPTP